MDQANKRQSIQTNVHSIRSELCICVIWSCVTHYHLSNNRYDNFIRDFLLRKLNISFYSANSENSSFCSYMLIHFHTLANFQPPPPVKEWRHFFNTPYWTSVLYSTRGVHRIFVAPKSITSSKNNSSCSHISCSLMYFAIIATQFLLVP